MSQLPWSIAIGNLLTAALTPAQVEHRTQYWKEDDEGTHHLEQNSMLRMHSYDSDGHNYLQEVALATGNAGIVIRGNDRAQDLSSMVNYADTIIDAAQTIHFKSINTALLWNYTPFNSILNPGFNLPPGLSSAEDAFNFAKASIPGVSSLADVQNQITGIQNTVTSYGGDLIPDGAQNYTDPFQAYCTLTPQKLPMMNYAAIMFLQMLMDDTPGLLACAAGPVFLGPVGIALKPLVKMQFQTAYNASVEGTVIGKALKQDLLAAIPGVGLAFS